MGFALVCLVAVVGLRVLSAPPEPELEEASQDPFVSEAPADDEATTSTQESSETTAVHSNPRVFTPEVRLIEEGASFFENETGWDLFVGGHQVEMTSIPIDGGEQATYGEAVPVMAVGNWLLAGNGPRTRVFDLSNPSAVPTVIQRNSIFGLSELTARPGTEANQVWLIEGQVDALKWQRWEIGAESQVVEEVDAPGSIYFGLPIHPAIASASSGGVFEVVEGEVVQRLAEGRLLAVTDMHAVVQQCENPLECKAVWLMLSNWEVDPDVVSPSVLNDLLWPVIQTTADNQRALITDARNGEATLWNLATGAMEQSDLGAAALSPDGRLLASLSDNGSLSVTDLQTGERTKAAEKRFFGYTRVLFVPSR